jgi:hypothetical protein
LKRNSKNLKRNEWEIIEIEAKQKRQKNCLTRKNLKQKQTENKLKKQKIEVKRKRTEKLLNQENHEGRFYSVLVSVPMY